MSERKHCTHCNTAFACGREDASCWCSALPALPQSALDAQRDCLCPDCLRAALARTGEHRTGGRDDAAPDPDHPA